MKIHHWALGTTVVAVIVWAGLIYGPVWLKPTEEQMNWTQMLSTVFSGVAVLGVLLTLREMHNDRIDRTRPAVPVEFRIEYSTAIYFVVRNVGQSLAEQVELSFEPVPIDIKGRPLTNLQLAGRPIPHLAPGAEIRHLFHVGAQLMNSDGPRSFTVRVRYRGVGGTKYSDEYAFDLEQYRDVTVPAKTVEDHLGTISSELKQVAHMLKKVTQADALVVEQRRAWRNRLEREWRDFDEAGAGVSEDSGQQPETSN